MKCEHPPWFRTDKQSTGFPPRESAVPKLLTWWKVSAVINRKWTFVRGMLKTRWKMLNSQPLSFNNQHTEVENVQAQFNISTFFHMVRIFLIISSTVSLKRVSLSMFFWTCWVAYTTVLWSRFPNSSPIEDIDIWVISRTIYMDT